MAPRVSAACAVLWKREMGFRVSTGCLCAALADGHGAHGHGAVLLRGGRWDFRVLTEGFACGMWADGLGGHGAHGHGPRRDGPGHDAARPEQPRRQRPPRLRAPHGPAGHRHGPARAAGPLPDLAQWNAGRSRCPGALVAEALLFQQETPTLQDRHLLERGFGCLLVQRGVQLDGLLWWRPGGGKQKRPLRSAPPVKQGCRRCAVADGGCW